MKRLSHPSAFIALLLTAAAFALRLAYLLGSHPFIDEFTTVLAARAVLTHGLPVLPSGLFYEHGLLFTYLDAPFVGLTGREVSFAPARLPSLLIGTVTVPFLYWIGRRWLSDRAGLVAAALLAFSPEGIVWGGRARMYALAQLLVLLLAFLVYEGSRGQGRPRLRRLALLTLLATLLTQFGALILVPPLVLGALVIGWLTRPDGVRPWFLRRAVLIEGVGLVTVVGLNVWVKRLGQPLGAAPLGSAEAGNPLRELWNTVSYQAGLALDGGSAVKFLAREFGVPHHLWLTVVALVGGILSLALWLRARESAKRRSGESQPPYSLLPTPYSLLPAPYSLLPAPYSLLFLWLLFGLTVLEMITLLEPFRRNPRYLVMALPLFYLIIAASLEQIRNTQYAIRNTQYATRNTQYAVRNTQHTIFNLHSLSLFVFALVQGALLISDLRIAYRTPEPAYEEAFQYVATQWQPGDTLLTMNTSAAALYLGQVDYFAIQEEAGQFLLDADTAHPVDRWLGAPWLGTAADLNRALNEHPRLWFVTDTIRLPVYYRGDWLALVKTQMELAWSGDEALVYRTRPDRSPIPDTPQVTLDAQLGDSVRLEGYAITQSADPPTLDLTLFWTPLAPMETDYTVFVHLRDATGATVAQRDAQPLDGDYPTSRWRVGEVVIDPHRVELPSDLPPGEYQLRVGLYRLETLERLPVANDTSGENAVVLGEVQVP